MDLSPSHTELLSQRINTLIDAALEAENAAQERRTYLGASRIGAECERRLAYEYHGHQGEPFKGKALRRFRLGHIHEDETARWLRLAGFDLRTHSEDGSQWGFMLADGKFGGHTDGIIVGGPDVRGLTYPCLFEHKIMKDSSWTATVKRGVRKEHTTYWAQCQIYMRQFGLQSTLFVALNTDTSALLVEIIPYDATEAEVLIAKAARIIESRAPEELPRVASQDTDYRCRWCPFKATCWYAPRSRDAAPAPRPMWLSRA